MTDNTAVQKAAEARYPSPNGTEPLTDAKSIASAAVAAEMARPSVAEAIREELA